VGVEDGTYARALDGKLETRMFHAGPAAMEALLAGDLDASYVGPGPAVIAFLRSRGEGLRVVAGAVSGGAVLVVRDATKPVDLAGKRVATPQLGNTQDVALRAWLADQGLDASLEGGGDVSIVPQANAQTLETFRAGEVQGAWVPEPWASRLVLEGGGSVLVDERSLWPDGRFVTTHVIVRTAFLRERADLVEAFLRAHVQAVDFLNAEPAKSRDVVNAAIGRLTGKPLPAAVLSRAWEGLSFTLDPIASSLRRSAEDATAVGLLEPVELDGIYELGALNEILAAAGRPRISI
jgi:NitT/TauT family transport system substrate-binding protein